MAKIKRPAKKEVDDACGALDAIRGEWMRKPGVTAVDVGFKISKGQLLNDVAIRVHVERKIPVDQLHEKEVLDENVAQGFPVDVIEASYGPASAPTVLEDADDAALEAIDRKSSLSPLIGGISCGNERATAGTLGAIVFDTSTCQPMILSNWHVLAAASAAAVGEPITQPGRVDGGRAPGDVVATLTRMELDSRMDAAVATLNGTRPHSRDILGLGTITGTEDAVLGMNVIKSGRTTGITKGVVDGVAMSTRINYGDPGIVRFSNQFRIVPRPPWPQVDVEISRGGDSGSVWMNESTNKAVGLHFAGETDPAPSSENAICNPIEPIMAELGFSFLPVLCAPSVTVPRKPPVEVDPFIRFLCMRFPFLCAPGGPLGGAEMASELGATGGIDFAALAAMFGGGCAGGNNSGRKGCGCGGCNCGSH